MERQRSQRLNGRRADPAVHHTVDSKKVVQDISGASMDSKVAHRDKVQGNMQTQILGQVGIAGAKTTAERGGETEGIADAQHEAIVPLRA